VRSAAAAKLKVELTVPRNGIETIIPSRISGRTRGASAEELARNLGSTPSQPLFLTSVRARVEDAQSQLNTTQLKTPVAVFAQVGQGRKKSGWGVPEQMAAVTQQEKTDSHNTLRGQSSTGKQQRVTSIPSRTRPPVSSPKEQ